MPFPVPTSPITLDEVFEGYDPERPFLLADLAYDRLMPGTGLRGGVIVVRSLALVAMLRERGFEEAGWEIITGCKLAKAYDLPHMPEPWRRNRPLVILGEDLLGNSYSKTSRMTRRWRLDGEARPALCIGCHAPEPKKMYSMASALGRARVFPQTRRNHDIYHFHVTQFKDHVQLHGVNEDRRDELYSRFREMVDERFHISLSDYAEASLPLQRVLSGDDL